MVRARGEPRRLPVHVRGRPAVAQEHARQRWRRRRSRSPTASTPTATSRTTSTTTRRAPRRSSRARPTADRAGSEPETQAMKGLLDRIGFSFQINYHSAGEWLLYAEGWQMSTPTADDPIYYALSGNLDEPAIEGFHPGLSSDVLYVTNGETTDYAHAAHGSAGVDARAGRGLPGLRLRVPGRRGSSCRRSSSATCRLRASVAESADDPDDPESLLGIETKPFYVESDDPYKEGIPGANFTFELLLRRPAAGPGAGEAEHRQGRRCNTASTAAARAAADPEWRGRRALRPDRRALPRDARRR